MTIARIRILVGSGAAVAIAMAALAPKAEAACWWNGYGWQCAPPPQTAYYTPPPYWEPAYPVYPTRLWGYDYGNSNQIPNDYPGPKLTHEGF